MFYEYLFQLVSDATKERIKQFISHKTIKLGVNQYSQAFKMIKDICSEAFYNLSNILQLNSSFVSKLQ